MEETFFELIGYDVSMRIPSPIDLVTKIFSNSSFDSPLTFNKHKLGFDVFTS